MAVNGITQAGRARSRPRAPLEAGSAIRHDLTWAPQAATSVLKMKIVFTFCAALLVQNAVAVAEPDDDLVDLDGDGDIDDDDRAAMKAAETIRIEDKSDGKKLEDSSRAVTVVDLKRAKERASDLGEVLSRAHGIQVRRTGGLGSSTRFSLNGLYDQQVRFFVDGIPVQYAGWGLGVANVPVDLVQRVDVYRGVVPIGLGADALGGAIDLVTDPSWADRASISYQAGSFGTHRASLGARVRDDRTGLALGLALFTDRAANNYPIDVEAPDDRGRPIPVTVRRFHDGYLASGGIVEAGVVQRGPRWIERALVRAFQTQYDKDLQHNTVMTVPYGEAAYASWSRGVAADITLASGPWRGRIVAGTAYTATDFRDVSTGIFDWFGKRIGDRPTPGEIGSQPTDQRITETGYFGRATLERALGAQHRVRIAIAPTRHHRTGEDFLDANPMGRDPIQAKRDLDQLVAGVEHEVKAFGDRFENTAFVKYYRLQSDAEDARPGFIFVPIEATIHRAGFGDSLRWKLTQSLALKASYEWATRMPSVDELFGDGILVQQNLELGPETSHNANLGIHLDRESGWGSFGGEVGGFARFADDLIILLGTDRVFSYQNVYAARILGVEGTVGWVAPGERATLEASATYQDIRNASSEGTFGAFDGDRIPNRPWLLGSVTGSVRHRGILGARDELSLFGTSRYVHSFYRGWESLGVRDSKQVVASQLVHGAGITYATRGAQPVTLTVEVQNLTDERAFDSFGVQKPGRGYYLKLSGEL